MNAFDAAEKGGRAADLQKELEELFNSQNTSGSQKNDIHSSHVLARDSRTVKIVCKQFCRQLSPGRRPFPKAVSIFS